LELIVSDFDIKSHKKYFEVMKKYRDYAIITLDDDTICTNDLIELLYNSYIMNPNCIHAMCVHKIQMKNNKVLPYDNWLKEYTFEFNPSFYLFPLSGRGTLFPPDIFNISDENLKEIYKCKNNVDIYLKYISRKRNIKIIWVPNKFDFGLNQYKIKKSRAKEKNIHKKIDERCLSIFQII